MNVAIDNLRVIIVIMILFLYIFYYFSLYYIILYYIILYYIIFYIYNRNNHFGQCFDVGYRSIVLISCCIYCL